MPATGTHPPNWINSNSTKGPSPSGSANADLRRAAVTALLSFSSFHPARGCRSHHLPALGQGALGHFAPMTVSGNGGLYFCRCRPHELARAAALHFHAHREGPRARCRAGEKSPSAGRSSCAVPAPRYRDRQLARVRRPHRISIVLRHGAPSAEIHSASGAPCSAIKPWPLPVRAPLHRVACVERVPGS